jgi:TPR repeat protein
LLPFVYLSLTHDWVSKGVRGKSINVKLTNESVVATVLGVTIISGRLYAPIVGADSLWELDTEKSVVTLHLEKQTPAAWPLLIASPLIQDQITTLDACSAFALMLYRERAGDSSDVAFELLQYSAEQKYPAALLRLFYVRSGRDLFFLSRENAQAALALALESPLNEIAECQYFVGRYYATDESDDWWQDASQHDRVYRAKQPRNRALALEVLGKAANQKFAPAILLLGDLFREGNELDRASRQYEQLGTGDALQRLAGLMLPPYTTLAKTTRQTLDMAKSYLDKARKTGATVSPELERLFESTEAEWKAANSPFMASSNFVPVFASLALVVIAGVAIAGVLKKGK